MRIRTPEKIKEVVLTSHKLGSNRKTADLYGLTIQTIVNYRKIYYEENPSEKVEFKRGGANRTKREINSIEDFSPKSYRIAKYLKRCPEIEAINASEALGVKLWKIYAIRQIMRNKGFI